jgi:hypothetical protein
VSEPDGAGREMAQREIGVGVDVGDRGGVTLRRPQAADLGPDEGPLGDEVVPERRGRGVTAELRLPVEETPPGCAAEILTVHGQERGIVEDVDVAHRFGACRSTVSAGGLARQRETDATVGTNGTGAAPSRALRWSRGDTEVPEGGAVMDHVRTWTVQITITEHDDERQSRQDAGGVQVACRYSGRGPAGLGQPVVVQGAQCPVVLVG